jgi:outer membrane protein TolC
MRYFPWLWWAIGCAGFLFPTYLTAQVLTLDEAVRTAQAQYPTLSAQRAALESVRTSARVLRDNRLPNLRLHHQLTLGTANGMSGSFFSAGVAIPTSGSRRAANRPELASGTLAVAALDWEVLNFGRFGAENALADADIALGESGLLREELGLQQAVIASYLDVFWLGQYLRIEQRNRARVDTSYRIITNLVRNGIRPGLDSSLASVAASRARLAYLRMREQYQQAALQLGMLTGQAGRAVPIDTTLRLEALLAPVPSPPPTEAHPLLRFRADQVARQQEEISLIRKAALPRVALMAGAWGRGSSVNVLNEYEPLGTGLAFTRTNVLLGVGTTVNLTDFRRLENRAQVQQFRVEEARYQLATERLELENALQTADSVLAVLRLQLAELPTALRSAQAAYDQRLALYNNGLENILALTDALTLLTAVEREYADTLNRAVRLRLQKAYATNDFTDFFALFRR